MKTRVSGGSVCRPIVRLLRVREGSMLMEHPRLEGSLNKLWTNRLLINGTL